MVFALMFSGSGVCTCVLGGRLTNQLVSQEIWRCRRGAS